MFDLSTLPPSSSPSPSSTSSGAATRPHTELAFLVHSPDTFSKDLPPDVDNRPLARQKRRRTSKEDEEILKAEYLKNPKPDKTSRINIVGKVALGEKEVQIWFQNKRQNDRRRSRPFDSSSSIVLSSEASNMSDFVTEDDTSVLKEENVEKEVEDTYTSEQVTTSSEADDEAVSEQTSDETVVERERLNESIPAVTESQSTLESIIGPSTDPHSLDTTPTEPDASQQSLSSSQGSANARSSWISNRRSASFRCTEGYASEVISFPKSAFAATVESPPEVQGEQHANTRSLKRTHSYVRLAMTDDGTARVITDADKTPSPPHTKAKVSTFARAAAGLRRSYSAVGLNERLAVASKGEPSPKIPRTASNLGRSRDSRAWEFWCDPDTRNSRSLTTRADQEGSGSAADAIGLLRANRKILAQNHSRQNASMLSRHGSSNDPTKNGVKKSRSLQRASTTSGRLQSKTVFNLKSGDSPESEELPQTESDKENWEPDTQNSKRSRNVPSTVNSEQPRQILGENTHIISQSSSLGAMLAREKSGKSKGLEIDRDNSDPERDEELRMFMKGGSAEEAGCVEGLLKLSQANWK